MHHSIRSSIHAFGLVAAIAATACDVDDDPAQREGAITTRFPDAVAVSWRDGEQIFTELSAEGAVVARGEYDAQGRVASIEIAEAVVALPDVSPAGEQDASALVYVVWQQLTEAVAQAPVADALATEPEVTPFGCEREPGFHCCSYYVSCAHCWPTDTGESCGVVASPEYLIPDCSCT